MDRRIEKAIGRFSEFSGVDTVTKVRVLGWTFTTIDEASRARERLEPIEGIAHKLKANETPKEK